MTLGNPEGKITPVGPIDSRLALQTAIALHQSERLSEAEPLYEAFLAREPDSFEALHALGALRLQRGDARAGADLLRRAIAVDSRHAPTHFNLGLALLALGSPDEALASFESASRLDPRSPESENGCGRALVTLSRYEDAIARFDRALVLRPGFLAALNNRGNVLRRLGRLDEALATFDRLLAVNPGDANAWNNRATVLTNHGRLEEGVASCSRALELQPDLTVAYLNRGNALFRLKRTEEARADFDRALSSDPNYADALRSRAFASQTLNRLEDALADFDKVLEIEPADAVTANNRGAILQALQRHEDALASFDRSIRSNPSYALAWSNRGNALLTLGRAADAVAAFDAAIAASPGLRDALMGRGNALVALGRVEEAAPMYQEAAVSGADATQVGYALAALGVAEMPAATPEEYVTKLFDQTADAFDDLLVDKLKYRTPALMMESLRRLAPAEGNTVLDIGCGTGLLGPALRPMAKKLVGVDLSGKMLDRARSRNCYDELVRAELTGYLEGRLEAFDLVVAADVFVYIGDLANVFRACGQALRAGGILAFSVEVSDSGRFELRPTRRYAHSLGYLRTMMRTNGFVELAVENRVIRQEAGADVDGYIIVAQRASY